MQERISQGTFWLMTGTAIFFDLLSFVPIVNFFSSIIGYATIFLWFRTKGVHFTKTSSMRKNAIAGFIIEFFPGFSALPAMTYSVWKITRLSRQEDAKKIQAPAPNTAVIHPRETALKKAA